MENRKKKHWQISQYRDNYNAIKHGLDKFSSQLFEFLNYEQHGISEKGIRSLIRRFGDLRQKIYSKNRKNKELFFNLSEIIDIQKEHFNKIKDKKLDGCTK